MLLICFYFLFVCFCRCLGYSSLSDYFPVWPMKPNPQCTSSLCLKRQAEYVNWIAPEDLIESKSDKRVPVVHESNEWGIELTSSSIDEEEKTAEEKSGLTYEF